MLLFWSVSTIFLYWSPSLRLCPTLSVLLLSLLFFFTGSSASKRSQGDNKHTAEDYGRKGSGTGSFTKVPPSPLASADRKRSTPTPSTVSRLIVLHACHSRIDGMYNTVPNIISMGHTEQHPVHWYESQSKLASPWEGHTWGPEWKGQVHTSTLAATDIHRHAHMAVELSFWS